MKIKTSLFVSLFFIFGCFGLKSNTIVKAEQKENEQPSTTEHSHCFCGGGTIKGDHTEHIEKTYMPWNGGDFNYDGEDGNTGSAFLYLTDDVVTNSNSCNRVTSSGILEINSNQTIYLCLNGHSLKNGKTTDNAIDVMGALYLCDCVGGGTIGGRTSGSSSGSVWVSNGIFNIYGGTLTGSYGVKNGAGIYVKGESSVTMYGGKITGNIGTRQGGGVFLSNSDRNVKCSFVMYDGEISNNSAPNFGGGVVVDNYTTFTMYDGKIVNNLCGGTGGGVFVSGGTFIMEGGTISGNEAANGGGVAVTYDTVRGNFTLKNGTITDNIAFGIGGGVYVWDRGDLLMHSGSISNNKAAYGGGVGIFSAEEDRNKINNIFDFYAGEIKNNSATTLGGGICCFQYTVLKLHGAGKIVVNENTESNLYFADKCTLEIDQLAEGSMIGVSALTHPEKGKPTSIYSKSGTSYSNYFFSDNHDYVLDFDENGISLTADFFRATIKYETGCEQELLAQEKTGFVEIIEMIISNAIPTKPCHTFIGWSEKPNANIAQYYPGDVITVKGEITLYAVWEESPHQLSLIQEEKATCEKDGVKKHYLCTECGKKFIETSDGTKIEVTSDDQLVLPMGHDLQHVQEVKASCEKDGVKEHYVCSECGKKFIETNDGIMVEVTSDDQLVLPKGHVFGTWQEAIESTTETEGTMAHKDCEICGKHFGINDVEIADITIPKLPKPIIVKKSGSTGVAIAITAGALIGLEGLAYLIFRFIRKKHI